MIICGPTFRHFFSVSLCCVAVSNCNKNHLEASDRCSKSGAGAEEGVLPPHSITQARASPHRATSQFAAIYMLTSFPQFHTGTGAIRQTCAASQVQIKRLDVAFLLLLPTFGDVFFSL